MYMKMMSLAKRFNQRSLIYRKIIDETCIEMFLFNLGVVNSKLHDMEPYCLLGYEHNRETIIIEDITE